MQLSPAHHGDAEHGDADGNDEYRYTGGAQPDVRISQVRYRTRTPHELKHKSTRTHAANPDTQ